MVTWLRLENVGGIHLTLSIVQHYLCGCIDSGLCNLLFCLCVSLLLSFLVRFVLHSHSLLCLTDCQQTSETNQYGQHTKTASLSQSQWIAFPIQYTQWKLKNCMRYWTALGKFHYIELQIMKISLRKMDILN